MRKPILLPGNALLPQSSPDVDPVADLAAKLMPNAADHMGFPQAQALLALAQQVGFDPNAVVSAKGFDQSPMPLLEFVLSRQPLYSRSSRVAWPETLDGFDESLLGRFAKGQPPPASWLAAVLMAAGADPWLTGESRDSTTTVKWGYPDDSNAPVFHALRTGQVGLLELMLKKPGAPELEELVHAPVVGVGGIREAATESWFHAACAEVRLDCLLEWMLERGVRPLADSSRHVLEMATPEAVKAFKEHGLLPTQSNVMRRLEAAWRQRAKSGDLSTEAQMAMVALLKGKEVRPDEVLASKFMVLLTKNPWGKMTDGVEGWFGQNSGAEFLNSRAQVETGVLAGQWSGLAAHLVNRLRQADLRSGGVPTFSFEKMLSLEERRAGLEKPLAEAIGFDWRDGVAMDGVVALLFVGQAKRSNVSRQEWLDELQKQAGFLGVSDLEAWSRQHVDASIAFTQVLASRANESASSALIGVWEAALDVDPGYLGEGIDRRLGLMNALHSGFSIAEPGRMRRMAKALTPWKSELTASYRAGDSQDVPLFRNLDDDELNLALEVALATNSSPWLRQVPDNMERFSAHGLDRIEAWLVAQKKHIAMDRSWAVPQFVQAIEVPWRHQKLNEKLEQPSPSPRSRPRM